MREQLSLLKKALPGLLYSFTIITIILLFKPNFLIITALVLAFYAIAKTYAAKRQGWKVERGWGFVFVRGAAILLGFLAVIYFLSQLLSPLGWLGLLLIVLFIVAYILARNWKVYMNGVRMVERQLFGETLDRGKKE